ncbi:hypothetical protein QMN02_05565 [Leptospira santarosai]|nr:hypothetical protein [Leptospira santarosai]MDI7164538.1 hypothetical protein [Leptospira santarosai]
MKTKNLERNRSGIGNFGKNSKQKIDFGYFFTQSKNGKTRTWILLILFARSICF